MRHGREERRMAPRVNAVERMVRRTIQREGAITFARYMEMALFSPGGGYYTTRESVGASRDFYTSPSAHPLFGALIALQLEQMWDLLGRPAAFWAVEVGAGSGMLARAVLGYAQHLDADFADALRYAALDVGPASSGDEGVRTIRSHGLPLRGVVGCILSNELPDSFPVHRFQVEDGRVREVYVALHDGVFAETLGEPSTPRLVERLPDALPDGFRGEVNLELDGWTEAVVRALKRGFVLTFDYGDTAGGLYAAPRAGGTLRCTYRHAPVADPFARMGEQDITAHVDFTALAEAGKRHGLATLGYVTQAGFLEHLGARNFLRALAARSRRDGMPQREYLSNRMGMLDLLRPEGLGGFKVLAQGAGVGSPSLQGFHPSDAWRQGLEARMARWPVPLATSQHVPLLEGRYPHAAFDAEALWPWAAGPGDVDAVSSRT